MTGIPSARVDVVRDVLHGVTIGDPYRWMEAEGEEFHGRLDGQAAHARAHLDALPGREELLARIRELGGALARYSGFTPVGDSVFSLVREPDARVAAPAVREPGGTTRVLFDPDTVPGAAHHAIDWFVPEHLIALGYTRPGRLAGQGVSAGGIPAGGALVRRPDLWAAMVLQVPAVDTARIEFSENGPVNVPEYGSVATEEGLRGLLAADAYLRVEDGVPYPAVLLTTGRRNPRVPPWQPGKMAARLQATTSSGLPVPLRVEEHGGHGFGATGEQEEQHRHRATRSASAAVSGHVVVDGAGPGRHQEDHVGAAGAEACGRLGRRPVGLRPGRLEPRRRHPLSGRASSRPDSGVSARLTSRPRRSGAARPGPTGRRRPPPRWPAGGRF